MIVAIIEQPYCTHVQKHKIILQGSISVWWQVAMETRRQPRTALLHRQICLLPAAHSESLQPPLLSCKSAPSLHSPAVHHPPPTLSCTNSRLQFNHSALREARPKSLTPLSHSFHSIPLSLCHLHQVVVMRNEASAEHTVIGIYWRNTDSFFFC